MTAFGRAAIELDSWRFYNHRREDKMAIRLPILLAAKA